MAAKFVHSRTLEARKAIAQERMNNLNPEAKASLTPDMQELLLYITGKIDATHTPVKG